MRGRIVCFVLGVCAFLLPLCVQAGDMPTLSVREYDGRFICQQGFFRAIYTTQGTHAVPAEDANGNGIPDFVEDMLKQFQVAHHVFCDLAGFSAPLSSPRYAGVRYVDAYIYSRDKLRGNTGLAFQESRPAFGAGGSGERALLIHVANTINPSANATPAHEYFHQIQNGLTHFSNKWYYEGMARWAEDAVALRVPGTPDRQALWTMLSDPSSDNALLALSYKGADMLWIPLASICREASVTLPADDPMLGATYVNGTPVMKDFMFSGSEIMKDVVQRLAAAETLAFTQLGYDKWYGNQRNEKNNIYILTSIRQSIESICK